jgi:hypothetical protein
VHTSGELDRAIVSRERRSPQNHHWFPRGEFQPLDFLGCGHSSVETLRHVIGFHTLQCEHKESATAPGWPR